MFKTKSISNLFAVLLSISIICMLISVIPIEPITVSAICCRKDGFDKSKYSLTDNMAEDVATIAKSQKGRTEAQFGYSGVDAGAWCDEFVADCIENAGADSSIVGHGGTVADFERVMRNKGAVQVGFPKIGDLIFFTKSHVEIVTKIENGVVYCAGGNNGGRMCKGERTASSVGTTRLYLRPNYPNKPDPVPNPPVLSINKIAGTPNDIINITWDAAQYAKSYWLHIYRNGEDYVNQTLNQELSYSAKYPAGKYTAYVISCNSQGEALSSVDFSIYDSNPEKPEPYIGKKSYSINETVTITWKLTQATDSYWLHIYRNGEDYINQTLNQELSYSATYPAGNYTAYIVSCNGIGETISSVDFRVYDTTPEKPSPKITKNIYYTDEKVEITWNETANTDHYWLHSYRNGEEYENKDLYEALSYSSVYPVGEYTVYIVSFNGLGETLSSVNFNVIKKGDINNDGKIDKDDAVILQNWLLGSGEMTNWQTADLCQDGIIDAYDLIMLRKLISDNK